MYLFSVECFFFFFGQFIYIPHHVRDTPHTYLRRNLPVWPTEKCINTSHLITMTKKMKFSCRVFFFARKSLMVDERWIILYLHEFMTMDFLLLLSIDKMKFAKIAVQIKLNGNSCVGNNNSYDFIDSKSRILSFSVHFRIL